MSDDLSDLSDLVNTNIYPVTAFEELERYSGYLDGIERMLETSERWIVPWWVCIIIVRKSSPVLWIAIFAHWLEEIKPEKNSRYSTWGTEWGCKTTIHRIKIKELQGNIIIIDGDSFRAQLPPYLALQQTYGKESVEYTK